MLYFSTSSVYWRSVDYYFVLAFLEWKKGDAESLKAEAARFVKSRYPTKKWASGPTDLKNEGLTDAYPELIYFGFVHSSRYGSGGVAPTPEQEEEYRKVFCRCFPYPVS